MAYTEKVNNIRRAKSHLVQTFHEIFDEFDELWEKKPHETAAEIINEVLKESGFDQWDCEYIGKAVWISGADQCLMVWINTKNYQTHIDVKIACRGSAKNLKLDTHKPLWEMIDLLLSTIRSSYFKTKRIDFEQLLEIYSLERLESIKEDLKDQVDRKAREVINQQSQEVKDELYDLFTDVELEKKLKHLQNKIPTLTTYYEWEMEQNRPTKRMRSKQLSDLGKRIYKECLEDRLLMINFLGSVMMECGAKRVRCTRRLTPNEPDRSPTFLFEKDGKTLYVRFFPVCINLSPRENSFDDEDEIDLPENNPDNFNILSSIESHWEHLYGENKTPYTNWTIENPYGWECLF
jgi:hypothetical protein